MWPNQQCAIDHWGEDCRDVTTTKLQCHVYKEWKEKREKNQGEGVGQGSQVGWGVRVDVNGEVKLL